MTRRTFEIVLIILGIILGSIASFTGTIIPTRVSVVTNQDTKVRIKQGGSYVSEIELGDLQYVPIHYENGVYYFSDTLSMDNLSENGALNEKFHNTYDISLTKYIDNAHLQVELVIEGNDDINGSIRALVKYKTETVILSQENPCAVFDTMVLSNEDQTIVIDIWYELEDPSCTIDNMNAAVGSNISLNLYANVTE